VRYDHKCERERERREKRERERERERVAPIVEKIV